MMIATALIVARNYDVSESREIFIAYLDKEATLLGKSFLVSQDA